MKTRRSWTILVWLKRFRWKLKMLPTSDGSPWAAKWKAKHDMESAVGYVCGFFVCNFWEKYSIYLVWNNSLFSCWYSIIFFGFFDFGVFSAFDLCQKMSENDFKRDVKRGKNLAFGNIPTIFWKSGLKMSDILSTSGWLYVYIVSAEKTVGSVFLEN